MNPAALPILRSMQAQTMMSLATVKRETSVQAADGSMTTTLTTVADDVQCRVDAIGGSVRESLMVMGIAQVTTQMIALPFDTDIRLSDRLVVNDKTYSVTGIMTGGDYQTARYVAVGYAQ